jgi:hypothetical protein
VKLGADAGGSAVNAEFFALAFSAALNAKLLAIDLLLIENRWPRAMFSCLLLGGMTVALTIGLLDVLTVHADALKAQGKASAGIDLGLGLLLLALGVLLATGRLHGRARTAGVARATRSWGALKRRLRLRWLDHSRPRRRGSFPTDSPAGSMSFPPNPVFHLFGGMPPSEVRTSLDRTGIADDTEEP